MDINIEAVKKAINIAEFKHTGRENFNRPIGMKREYILYFTISINGDSFPLKYGNIIGFW
jgi:hypothetical protein